MTVTNDASSFQKAQVKFHTTAESNQTLQEKLSAYPEERTFPVIAGQHVGGELEHIHHPPVFAFQLPFVSEQGRSPPVCEELAEW